MTDIYLIRHGKTAGNEQHRYVGSTDEELSGRGIAEICEQKERILRQLSTDGADAGRVAVYVSPMKRCRQTAALLFPAAEQHVCEELREMDFGAFEYKNYEELIGDARYQAFIDSGGVTDFPEAEPQAAFRERCAAAFLQCVQTANPQKVPVFVVHGGTIMSVLERYAVPQRPYFDWQCAPVNGYRAMLTQTAQGIALKNVMRLDLLDK